MIIKKPAYFTPNSFADSVWNILKIGATDEVELNERVMKIILKLNSAIKPVLEQENIKLDINNHLGFVEK